MSADIKRPGSIDAPVKVNGLGLLNGGSPMRDVVRRVLAGEDDNIFVYATYPTQPEAEGDYQVSRHVTTILRNVEVRITPLHETDETLKRAEIATKYWNTPGVIKRHRR